MKESSKYEPDSENMVRRGKAVSIQAGFGYAGMEME